MCDSVGSFSLHESSPGTLHWMVGVVLKHSSENNKYSPEVGTVIFLLPMFLYLGNYWIRDSVKSSGLYLAEPQKCVFGSTLDEIPFPLQSDALDISYSLICFEVPFSMCKLFHRGVWWWLIHVLYICTEIIASMRLDKTVGKKKIIH